MTNTRIDQDVQTIHELVKLWGYDFGLKRAHRVLGTKRYHDAYGPWETEDEILDRYEMTGGKTGIVVTERKG